jgi:hypothetical protein
MRSAEEIYNTHVTLARQHGMPKDEEPDIVSMLRTAQLEALEAAKDIMRAHAKDCGCGSDAEYDLLVLIDEHKLR